MSLHDPRLVRETLDNLVEVAQPDRLMAELAETGWCELHAEDIGLAVGALFEAQGKLVATSPMLATLLSMQVCRPGGRWAALPAPTLVPGPGVLGPPAVVRHGVLHVDGFLFGRVPLQPLRRGTISGLDPSLRLSRLTGVLDLAETESVAEVDALAWAQATATCRLAVGHEIVGAAGSALELAIEHARQRTQFSRPIGAFQAIQHRLADALAALDVARLALDAAWREFAEDTAVVAKALAGDAARVVAREAQQVLGGMGFTWEHPFHRRLRRMLSLDLFFGSCREHERRLGVQLIESRRLPALRAL
jgi:Acyl-CoA dehydrogenase, C-terminal domain